MAGDNFDAGYRRWRRSEVHTELLGDGLPPEVAPFSFVPLSGMHELTDLLRLQAGQTLVDLGCGRGGPGLWIARQSGARVIGVDSSAVAIADAQDRRHLFPEVAADFFVGDVSTTGLAAGSAAGVVSIDVMQLLNDPRELVAEAVRILRPGGRFVATTWEGQTDNAPPRFPHHVRALLESVGLQVDVMAQRPIWLERQLRIYQRAAAVTTRDAAVDDLAREGTNWSEIDENVRRVLISAHRPG